VSDGAFSICRRCPYRAAPPTREEITDASGASEAEALAVRQAVPNAGGCCLAEALVKTVLELSSQIHALQAQRADEAKEWAKLFAPGREEM
jgi:hypothetical protein